MPWDVSTRQTDYSHQAAKFSHLAPRVPWRQFLRDFDWQPGQHVTIIAPTGHGKTVLLQNLAGLRTYGVIMGTKPPMDIELQRLIPELGFEQFPEWRKLDPDKHPRRLIWYPYTDEADIPGQARSMYNTYSGAFAEAGWNVFVDEMWWHVNKLNLGGWIESYLFQARSSGTSLIVATQRPAAVPVPCYDQATWLFIGRDNDRTNLDRLAGIGSLNSAAMRPLVASLERYQFLVIDTRTGRMWRTHTPPPKPWPPPVKKNR